MATDLHAVWHHIAQHIKDGISLIPVRDREDTSTAVYKAAKTPFGKSWKEFQTRQATEKELWYAMEQYDTTAVAMIGGKVSGNLEIIDIDVKYRHGIDAILFADIGKFFPHIYAKLRIHRTPSGGYHILYRVQGGIVEGNMKLAGRYATEAELIDKPKNKTYNFLETRGEGGYALLPPSMGYTVHIDNPIPILTWAERCSLITICQSYNEVVKVAPQPKTTTQHNSGYYSENPFEHFNSSTEAENILEQHGWKFFNENSNYKYYTRPDRPHAGISASFNKTHRLYYIWSTSTEIDSNTHYNPATLLAILQFNNDKKRLHKYLVEKGYGKLSEQTERRLITKAGAYKTDQLPTNLSPEAQQWVQEAISHATELHPFGIFWGLNEDDKPTISRERLYRVSEQLGYRLHLGDLCRIQGYTIHPSTQREFYDTLRAYIRIEDADEYERIFNCLDSFLQGAGKHITENLPLLQWHNVITSSKVEDYKFYSNCYISITGDNVTTHQYDNIGDKLIWANRIKPRNFTQAQPDRNTLFYQYLEHATRATPHVHRCIGYLCHDYKDASASQFILLVEECPDPKLGGGSGKNIFGTMIGEATTWMSMAGTLVKTDDVKFLQSWHGQRVISINDIPKNFDFEKMKAITDGTITLKRLFKDEVQIPISDGPKFIFSTNFSFENMTGGTGRRNVPIEFTDFFTRSKGVDTYFGGKMFPTDFSEADWNTFDNMIVNAIQSYLKWGKKLEATELSDTGWDKQFRQVYGELTMLFIEEHMQSWIAESNVAIKKFDEQYDQFLKENGANMKFKLTSIRMNQALTQYCEKNNVPFEKRKVVRLSQYETANFKCFGNVEKEEEIPF